MAHRAPSECAESLHYPIEVYRSVRWRFGTAAGCSRRARIPALGSKASGSSGAFIHGRSSPARKSAFFPKSSSRYNRFVLHLKTRLLLKFFWTPSKLAEILARFQAVEADGVWHLQRALERTSG